VLHLALLAVSTIFSSRVAIAGDEVLLRANLCGWIYADEGSASKNYSDMSSTEREDLGNAESLVTREFAARSWRYVQSCYNASSGSQNAQEPCKSYAASQIPFTARSVPCPFSKDICALPNATQFDSGYVDSDQHMGINTVPDLRVRVRKLLTCVPLLAEERFSSNWTHDPDPSTTLPGDTYRYYFLGPAIGYNYTWFVNNYTFWDLDRNSYAVL